MLRFLRSPTFVSHTRRIPLGLVLSDPGLSLAGTSPAVMVRTRCWAAPRSGERYGASCRGTARGPRHPARAGSGRGTEALVLQADQRLQGPRRAPRGAALAFPVWAGRHSNHANGYRPDRNRCRPGARLLLRPVAALRGQPEDGKDAGRWCGEVRLEGAQEPAADLCWRRGADLSVEPRPGALTPITVPLFLPMGGHAWFGCPRRRGRAPSAGPGGTSVVACSRPSARRRWVSRHR